MAKHYNPEFKEEIAEFVVDKHYSVREVAEAMNVGKSVVDKWARLFRKERNGHEMTSHPISAELRKFKALEFQIQRLRMEKYILKKATALIMLTHGCIGKFTYKLK